MTVMTPPASQSVAAEAGGTLRHSQSAWGMALHSRRVLIGGGMLVVIVLFCVATLPATLLRG